MMAFFQRWMKGPGAGNSSSDNAGSSSSDNAGNSSSDKNSSSNKKESLEQLIIKHLPATRRYARALIGDAQLSNEAVVHAVTKMSKMSLPWVPAQMVRLWLIHLVHDYIDNQVPANVSENADEDEQASDSDPFGMQAQMSADSARMLTNRIDESLQNLTEVQRRIYLLATVEAIAIENVGMLLKLPLDTVRTEMESARAQLLPSPKASASQLPKAA